RRVADGRSLDEAEVLMLARDPRVVRRLEEPMVVNGRTATVAGGRNPLVGVSDRCLAAGSLAISAGKAHDGAMSGRFLQWVGGLLVIAAVIASGAYFWALGLDKADKLASVIGALVAIAGIGLTIQGTIRSRRGPVDPGRALRSPDIENVISGGSQRGPVIQGRDFHGPVRLGMSETSHPKAVQTASGRQVSTAADKEISVGGAGPNGASAEPQSRSEPT
ncbi:hypothetical protein, partial [Sphaerimonospora thailandensis]|uniref:hypothetical protein n=1 Tax=Sphaerimonospora thailandensis TaxID=795644 RepID=UPI0019509240